jgi:hypothetical protein
LVTLAQSEGTSCAWAAPPAKIVMAPAIAAKKPACKDRGMISPVSKDVEVMPQHIEHFQAKWTPVRVKKMR